MSIGNLINTILIVAIAIYLIYKETIVDENSTDFIPELTVERLNVVGTDKNPHIIISNPERQVLPTINGVPIQPDGERDVPGITFYNRVGDEVGGIFYDGTDSLSDQGITFDQQKNDQVMAIMKREYIEDNEWKRWYGMYFRERVDSARVYELFDDFNARTKSLSKERRREEYLKFKKYLDENINKYRLFLGREENRDVGLFLYDSKSRERIKLYIDPSDNAKLEILDTLGNVVDLLSPTFSE
ncbi:MAG: hypothetical protein AAF632_27495 [Bacteroidota bacterium]